MVKYIISPLMQNSQFTYHALCWNTCRGSVRKRVPNCGRFWASVKSSVGPLAVSGMFSTEEEPAATAGTAMITWTGWTWFSGSVSCLPVSTVLLFARKYRHLPTVVRYWLHHERVASLITKSQLNWQWCYVA